MTSSLEKTVVRNKCKVVLVRANYNKNFQSWCEETQRSLSGTTTGNSYRLTSLNFHF